MCHAVRPLHGNDGGDSNLESADERCLCLEVRNAKGERRPADDLELELYRSGSQLNLTLTWAADPARPMLWQGSHPVWMDGTSGQRCERPADGLALESLARRLRSLLG
jgi:hypothetical protein